MKWSDVCEDKVLQKLPYKIELDEWGNIVTSRQRIAMKKCSRKRSFTLLKEQKNTGFVMRLEM